MAVKPNSTTEGGSTTLYTGLATFKVVAINPTQQKMKELGYKAEKEPVYFNPETGRRIVFFLEAKAGEDTIRTNRAFFLKDKIRQDIFVNKQGNFNKDRSKLTGETRMPYDGEIDLLNFIQDWCNVKKDQECYLETIERIIRTGDLFELNEIFDNAKNNVFKALCIVRDGKYQGIYERKLIRSWSTDLSYLHKSLAENEQYLRGDIGPIDLKLFVPEQFELRPYTATTATAKTALELIHAQSENGVQPKAETPAADDDAPF
jgi:hypothetical protein